jgi:hypothetical protein
MLPKINNLHTILPRISDSSSKYIGKKLFLLCLWNIWLLQLWLAFFSKVDETMKVDSIWKSEFKYPIKLFFSICTCNDTANVAGGVRKQGHLVG